MARAGSFGEKFARRENMIAHLQDKIEGLRWDLAKMIWEENNNGTPLSVIANEIGKSKGHAGLMRRCWEHRGSMPDGMGFNAWYNRLKKNS